MKYLFLILSFSLSLSSFAQKPASKKTQQQFVIAKEFLKKSNYSAAMQNFKLVLATDNENEIVQSASFYYGLSAYLRKDFMEAKLEFLNYLKKYPNWSKNEEIYYMLSDIYFQEQKDKKALENLQQLKTIDIKTDGENMKGHYLIKRSKQALKDLLKIYPNDKLIGQLLVDKMAMEANTLEEIGEMDSIVKKMSLKRPKKTKINRKVTKKDMYNVAVLLPFRAKHYNHYKKNSYISKLSLSLFQGFRMAKAELDTTSDTKYNLYAYEIGRSSEKLDSILEIKELENMDLIIGPIYPKTFHKIADFGEKNKINVVVPVSNEPTYLKSDFTYLYEATPEVMSKECVKFSQKEFNTKEAIIIFDDLRKNKELAKHYKKSLEDAGIKVVAYEEVTSSTTDKIPNILKNNDNSNLGHIFVSSTSQVIAKEVVNSKKNSENNTPVIVPEAWLKFEGYDSLQYEQQKLYFIAPHHVNTRTSAGRSFTQAFEKNTKIENTDNLAQRGYDIFHFFTKLLEENGIKSSFRYILKNRPPEKGRVVTGFNFRDSNSNAVVPILKFERQVLIQVNKIE